MQEKYKNILQIILVIILIIGVLVFKTIPEYNKSKGSSDAYIDIDTYTDIIELKINEKPNFAIVTTTSKITNILFFDRESLCLYNQSIEGLSIKKGIEEIIDILIANGYLRTNDILIITKYKGKSYNQVANILQSVLIKKQLVLNIQEQQTSIEQKQLSLNLKETDEVKQIKAIELYSKDIVRYYKNNLSVITPPIKEEIITEENARDYTDMVYKKIETYVRKNNIQNEYLGSTTLELTQIPVLSNGRIYPDNTSYYYVVAGKVYAYISINYQNKNYSYCYQASIDVFKEGQC